MGDSYNLRSASASSLFRYFVFVIIYRENPDSQRKGAGKNSSFLTAQLQISVELDQKLERQIVEGFCLKTESLAVSIRLLIFIDGEVFHLKWENERISQPVTVIIVWWKIFLQRVLKVPEMLSYTTCYTLMQLDCVLQDIHSSYLKQSNVCCCTGWYQDISFNFILAPFLPQRWARLCCALHWHVELV